MIENKQEIWGMLAIGYFFLAGTAAMTAIVALLLSFGFIGADIYGNRIFIAFAVSLVLAGLGGMLLLAELTKKFRFPLVFCKPKSLMTIGAFALSSFMFFNFVYALLVSGWVNVPYTISIAVAIFLAIAAVLLAVYPALEMAEARGRSFWGAGLVPLFLLNALACGFGILLTIGLDVRVIFFGVLLLNLVVLIGYIWSAELSGIKSSRRGADLLLRGELKVSFIGGAILLGLIAPLILVWFSPIIAGLCSLIGGFYFRYTFMKAGVRIELPGENNVKYSDKELMQLADTLDKHWQEKATITSGRYDG